jgi:hypothetical protein
MILKGGLSGCKLEIIQNGVVRKYSPSIKYNNRLIKQINKQIFFSNLILKNLDTPKILSKQVGHSCFFDMEYIPGKKYYDYLSISNHVEINFIVESLSQYFDFLINNHRLTNIKKNLIIKLDSVKKKSLYDNYISFLQKYINSREVIYVPKTFCHGDLTFSNIIFHKNRLYFIDFLDSYVDSFLCDLVKLKQDLVYLWNVKIENKNSARIHQVYKHIWNCIYQKYFLYIDSDEFNILDSINYLRIEPYLTNDYQKDVLYKIIKKTKLYEKFVNTNGRKIN